MTTLPITSRHLFGFAKEVALQKKIEEAIGEPLVKSLRRMAQMDYVGDTHMVELKSRQSPILPDTYPTWLLPTCKAPAGKQTKDTIYFYHFEEDDSLWFLYYDEEQFSTFERQKPFWHPTRQEHFLIPRSEWTKI